MSEPKYPNVEVQLTGRDGNAFGIIGRCMKVAKDNGVDKAEISKFVEECQSGDYQHLLRTVQEWFSVS
jgi:hypothetical protein